MYIAFSPAQASFCDFFWERRGRGNSPSTLHKIMQSQAATPLRTMTTVKLATVALMVTRDPIAVRRASDRSRALRMSVRDVPGPAENRMSRFHPIPICCDSAFLFNIHPSLMISGENKKNKKRSPF